MSVKAQGLHERGVFNAKRLHFNALNDLFKVHLLLDRTEFDMSKNTNQSELCPTIV